jgi:hypothetical protein
MGELHVVHISALDRVMVKLEVDTHELHKSLRSKSRILWIFDVRVLESEIFQHSPTVPPKLSIAPSGPSR